MIKNSRLLVLGILLVGCNDDPTPVGPGPDDAGVTDLGTPADRPVATDTPAADRPVATDNPVVVEDVGVDAGTPDLDAGPPDVGTPDLDAGPPDAGTPDAGATDVGATDAGTPDAGAVDGAACPPATETCNGLDDDCDGIIDESGCATHLLITEVVPDATNGEFIEIHNPTAGPIDLSNVYLSDFHDYACYLGRACTVAGRATASLGGSDFVARFPAGATLAAGQYATVSLSRNVTAFNTLAGACPTFYLPLVTSDAGVALGPCTASLPMRPTGHAANTLGTSAGLTNNQEPVILFQWDGAAPLVTDLDYVYWGTATASNPQVDKSGTSVTPTGGTAAMYRADTLVAMQQRAPLPGDNTAVERCNFGEGTERRTGGNGLGGHDETSEPLASTWRLVRAATAMDAGVARLNATPNAANRCR